jgi:hypothetical protein
MVQNLSEVFDKEEGSGLTWQPGFSTA